MSEENESVTKWKIIYQNEDILIAVPDKKGDEEE